MSSPIRIGTRDSDLALWQATHVQKKMTALGLKSVLVPLKSEGDQNLIQPLYEMGVVGVFTKVLDTALLNDRIDIAVHSMKDVPTQLPEGLVQVAVLERESPLDLLVFKTNEIDFSKPLTIATSSLRRKAQWLCKYPHHQIEVLRGNVNTRLQKLKTSNWDGAIFAKAGLERLNMVPKNSIDLFWMTPAPAQGALMVVAKSENPELCKLLSKINHPNTAKCVQIERNFLKTLQGGCSAPIGALAQMKNKEIHFAGNISHPNGNDAVVIDKTANIKSKNLGELYANEILSQGGKRILEQINR